MNAACLALFAYLVGTSRRSVRFCPATGFAAVSFASTARRPPEPETVSEPRYSRDILMAGADAACYDPPQH